MTANGKARGYETCGARKRQGGGDCTRPAGWGTDHAGTGRCKLHGGSTRNQAANAQALQARAAAEKFGLPIKTTPAAALQDELERTAGLIAYYMARASALDEEGLIWGTTERTVKTGSPPGQQRGGQQGQPSMDVRQEAKPNIWLVLLERERRHFAQVATEMARLGIERRAVAATEMQMAQFKRVLDWLLKEMPDADRLRLLPQLPGKLRELTA